MFISIVNLFIFFSSGLILLMAFMQILATRRHILNIINFVILFCLGLTQIQLLLIYVGNQQLSPIFYFLHLTTLYAAGPASYLSLDVRYSASNQLTKRELFHFTPACAMLFLEIVIQLLPEPVKTAVIGEMIAPNFSEGVHLFLLLRFIGFLHLAGYLSVYLLMLYKNWHLSDIPTLSSVALNNTLSLYSVIHVLVALMFLIVSQLFAIDILSKMGIILLSLIGMCWYFFSFRFPDFFYLFQKEVSRKRYRRSIIGSINTDETLMRLRTLMEEEKVFCDEDITLKNVADELDISPHQLSELLNARLNMNFKTFINTYRVEEAKKLLIDEPERSILSIAFAVGFNSRSNFNTVFLKLIGQPPSDFRKESSYSGLKLLQHTTSARLNRQLYKLE